MKKLLLIGLLLLQFGSLFFGCSSRTPNLSIPVKSNNFIVKEAQKYLGKPYEYGKIGPDSFDCSGFVYGIFKNLGIAIPRTSLAQSGFSGKKLSQSELKAGDMVFFDTSEKGHVNHSGIYLGENKFIHASSGAVYSVTISDMNGWYKDKFKWGKHLDENK